MLMDNSASIVSTGGSVIMLFVVEPKLFYSLGGLVAVTCIIFIGSTVLGCFRRERRLEDLKTRAQRRKAARATANNSDGRCC